MSLWKCIRSQKKWQIVFHLHSLVSDKPVKFSSVLQSFQLFATPWNAAHQASLSITNTEDCSNSCPSSHWCHPTISSAVFPFSSHLLSFPASGSFPMTQFFTPVTKVLEFQLKHQFFHWIFRTDFLWDGLVWSPCSPRDSQEFSPIQFSSVQSLSRVRFFATPWITASQASLSITNSQSSLRLTSIESVMPSSHLILCRPLLLLPPIPPSIRVFSNESTLRMRWPKYWTFSFSIIPSQEIPGLISFRRDWLDLLAVQGTL